MIPYVPPEFRKEGYNCPHCNAYSRQLWADVFYNRSRSGWVQLNDLDIAVCVHCSKYTLWRESQMLFPDASGITIPNHDLSEDIKADYDEAKSILNKSPRGAAALLRLGIQKLCVQLGEQGRNINEDIGSLVRKGLPVQIQQALDIVRVIGNNAVHPGQMDIRDDRAISIELFKLVNLIAEIMITQPKKVQEMYNSLPQSARDGIDRRDSGGGSSSGP